MSRLWQHIRPSWRRWAVGIVMLLCTTGSTAVVVELERSAIDRLRAHASLASTQAEAVALAWQAAGALKHLAGLMVGAALLGALFRTLSRVLIFQAARDAELSLRQSFFAHLTTLDQSFYRIHPPGELMSRATSDLTQVRLLLGPALLYAINALLAYAVALPLMLKIDVRLTCLAFSFYPPALWWLRRLGAVNYRRNRAQQEALGRLANFVQENIAAAATVRAFAIEPEQARRFADRNQDFLRATLRLTFAGTTIFRLAGSLTAVGALSVAALGARDVACGRLSLGDVVALVEWMALLSGHTTTFGWVLSFWQRGQASLARLDEVFLSVPAVAGGLSDIEPAPRALDVEHIAVDYGRGRGLADLSFRLQPGETLGIVGAIGSGKTTVMRALLRLTPLSAGQISLGGQNIEGLTLASLRSHFSYAPQDASLLSKSIFDNVAFGRPDAKADEVVRALELAGFADEAAAMPDGLNTVIGERGVSLSGGQKQRCALARALLVPAPILLLDDTLSAVDTVTEARILTALKARASGQSTIVVAHRLATVAHADHILFLVDGRVGEAGTHAALMQRGGAYAAMARKQRLSGPPKRGEP